MQFYQHPLPTDLPVLVLSTGRCLLKDSGVVQVPLVPTTPSSSGSSWGAAAAAALEALAPSEVDLVRDYLLWVRGRPCALPKEVAEALTQRYVELHAADEAFDGDRFSNCITVRQWDGGQAAPCTQFLGVYTGNLYQGLIQAWLLTVTPIPCGNTYPWQLASITPDAYPRHAACVVGVHGVM